MKNFKGLYVVLALLVALLALAGCNNQQSTTAPTTPESQAAASQTTVAPTTQTSETTTTTVTTTDAANQKFVLDYPADMKEMGFTEALELEKMPERIVSLTVVPVPVLFELGVNMVGIPTSRVMPWPEELAKNVTMVNFNAHSPEDFDFESLVVLEADLVILTSGAKDTAGKKLVEEFNIPVYYVKGGHSVEYNSVKMQTEELVKAFGRGDAEAKGKAILKRFADLEAKVVKAKEAFAGKSVMVLQSAAGKHFIQTKGGTLGSMLDMIGFTNVFENQGNSMVQLDLEKALSYNPDYLVCVGAGTSDDHKALMAKEFAENPDYWKTIPAIEKEAVLYLGMEYIPNTGIHVVRHIEKLVDYMSELTGIEVK